MQNANRTNTEETINTVNIYEQLENMIGEAIRVAVTATCDGLRVISYTIEKPIATYDSSTGFFDIVSVADHDLRCQIDTFKVRLSVLEDVDTYCHLRFINQATEFFWMIEKSSKLLLTNE